MAYDRELAERIRHALEGVPDLSEKAMFGGLAFLVGGNMAVSASGKGGLMVRVDPAESDALVELSGVELVEMGGRSMKGWLRVDAAQVKTDDALAQWVNRGVAYAGSLPPKK